MDYQYQKINLSHSILVLNSDYNPINICSARRAIVLLIKQKAHMITQKIIRLVEYIRIPSRFRVANNPTRNLIMKRDDHKCGYCGAKENLTIDHIIPSSRGGMNTWQNLVTCCVKCNSLKGNRTPHEASMLLRIAPKEPYNKITLSIKTSNNSEWKEYLYE